MAEAETRSLIAQIRAGAEALGLVLEEPQLAAMAHYLRLLEKWNRRYNLTAVRAPAAMVTHHVLDSLAVTPYVWGSRLLDLGSGAGLPGLVLAIAAPQLRCTLLDSNAKKTRFLTQVALELGLDNVEIVRTRVEAFRPATGFDTVIARAFAELAGLRAATARLCAPDARVLAMKGKLPQAELDAVPPAVRIETHRLDVPGMAAQRHLIIMQA